MEENTDPIQAKLSGVLADINGFPGDLVVFFLLGLVVLALIKRKYKVAVGFFVLTLGIVLVRVLISNLF